MPQATVWVAFFFQPQRERFHLCATVVLYVLPGVDGVVEGCPRHRAEPQGECGNTNATFHRGACAENAPVEGNPQHDLRNGEDSFGERIERGDGQDGTDEQKEQDGVCRQSEQDEQTHTANKNREDDKQQGLAFRKGARRQRARLGSGSFFINVVIEQVVPRATRRTRNEGCERKKEDKDEPGAERVGLPVRDLHRGERDSHQHGSNKYKAPLGEWKRPSLR